MALQDTLTHFKPSQSKRMGWKKNWSPRCIYMYLGSKAVGWECHPSRIACHFSGTYTVLVLKICYFNFSKLKCHYLPGFSLELSDREMFCDIFRLRETFWSKFWISLYVLYIFTSPSPQNREKSASLGRLFLPNHPLGWALTYNWGKGLNVQLLKK